MFTKNCLSDFLIAKENEILYGIKKITDIKKLTDNFVQVLIKDSLISLIELNDEIKTNRGIKYVKISELPFNRGFGRDVDSDIKVPRTVVKVSISFTGDARLLNFSSKEYTRLQPGINIIGNKIKFDVVLWEEDKQFDDEWIVNYIKENQNNIKEYVKLINNEVEEFNSKIQDKIFDCVKKKKDRLKQEDKVISKLQTIWS